MCDKYVGRIEMILSCVIPIYNKPNELKYLLKSLCDNKSKFELVLVDDCSTDIRVRDVIQNFAKICPKNIILKISYQPVNYGIAENTNIGIRQATGKYIALIDADDYIHTCGIDYLIKKLEIENPDWGFTDRTDLLPNGYFMRVEYGNQLLHREMPLNKALMLDMVASHLKFYRRDVFEIVGYFDSNYDNAIDYDMALRLANTDLKALYLNDKIYCHRISASQTTNTNWLEQVREANKLRSRYLKKLEGNDEKFRIDYEMPNSLSFIDYYKPFYQIEMLDSKVISFDTYEGFINYFRICACVKSIVIYPNGYIPKKDLLEFWDKVEKSVSLIFNSNVNRYSTWYQFYGCYFSDIYCVSPSEAMLFQLSCGFPARVKLFSEVAK